MKMEARWILCLPKTWNRNINALLQVSIPVDYIETVETTADGEEIHIAHSGGELEGSTVILDPVLQVSVKYASFGSSQCRIISLN